jgi:hypothetical protein
VTCPINVPVGNKSFQLNTTNCDSLQIFVCPPTNNTGQYPENQFLDIAMDKHQNLYYVSGGGSLYKRSLTDTTSCQYLGTFNMPINALVADTANLIYGASQVNGICRLYRYNISSDIFDTVGAFPTGFFSAGDLFFYEGNLFLTGTDAAFTSSYLIQVNIADPSQSCYYMGLQNLQPCGAFSINYGTFSKAYILTTNGASISSSLIELDLVNKTIGNPICTYPFWIAGASIYYNITSNSSVCDTTYVGINNIINFNNAVKLSPNPFSNLLTLLCQTTNRQK